MKQLTIEEKAKAYDEAFRIAQELYNDPNSSNVGKGYVYTVFPELKESEDERIRKWLITQLELKSDVNNPHDSELMILKSIAWLERQDEQKTTNNQFTPEQAGVIDEYIDKFNEQNGFNEQKLADKVEPKFKAGDWAVSDLDKTTRYISEVHNDKYNNYYVIKGDVETECDIYEYDRLHHLWTIQDAKAGDVLVYKDEISLYKHDIKNCTKQETTFGGFVYHCCYDGKRFITDSLYSLTEKDKKDIYPATKEQRDTLMKAMADAGYTFDFEKKELNKIENEIEIPFGAKDSELQEATYYIPKGFYSVLDGNKVIIKRFKTPRPQNN